jgi:hypothetical protein
MLDKNGLKSKIEKRIKELEKPLAKKLAGGDSDVRIGNFVTDSFDTEELVIPPAGLYKAQKNIDKWYQDNLEPPGIDQNSFKKKQWKNFADEISNQLAKELVDVLSKELSVIIAEEIDAYVKDADIKLTIPSGFLQLQSPAGPATNAAPITLSSMNFSFK